MTTPKILLTAAAALALGAAVAPVSAQDMPSVPQRTHIHTSYQNGGIGKEQIARMDRHMQPYDLRLTFSEGPHNAYAAGLQLNIYNAKGEDVFALSDAGPLTDVKLPAGHYRVVADFGGVQRSGSVDIQPGQHASLNLHWPKDET
ncbi:hypothetical protein [Stenotrophomonas sp. YIM B06876]|uniref:hypothetical protein n=1 Tax=Stenotrophomonas sp. YIM B06876 TaxID=3060211 RepID=UPI002738652D|nr:hypothetical protein [Stenotrophomonas sp. YIM B06876]